MLPDSYNLRNSNKNIFIVSKLLEFEIAMRLNVKSAVNPMGFPDKCCCSITSILKSTETTHVICETIQWDVFEHTELSLR